MDKSRNTVTQDYIESLIVAEYWASGADLLKDAPEHPSLQTLTICVLILKNGFTVVGSSNCVDPENFDADIGKSIARASAKEKIWALEGYVLRNELSK